MTAERLEQSRRYNRNYYGFGPEAMKNIRICSRCKAPSSTATRFCGACGGRLPHKTLYQLYRERHAVCPGCDTVLTDEMAFCPHCGKERR